MTEEKLCNGLVDAVSNGDWDRATHLAAIKVADMMEKTESPRETKALSISLINLIERCQANDVVDSYADTPLAEIMRKADEAMKQHR